MKRILLVGALAVAWAVPAAAQHSRLFECLQRARGGLSAETMLAGCRAEVREWLADCEQVFIQSWTSSLHSDSIVSTDKPAGANCRHMNKGDR